jgi:ABC-2 type transport system ATP-binding protein
MKQQFAIVAALVNNPELLILDEPKNGLDPEGINHIRVLIIKIDQKWHYLNVKSHTCSMKLKSL